MINLFKKFSNQINQTYNTDSRLVNLFKTKYKKKESKEIILVEYFKYKNSLISFALLANCLSDLYNAKIIAYSPTDVSLIRRLKNKIFDFLKNDFCEKIYKAFGTHKIIYPKLNKNFSKQKFIFKNRKSIINFSRKKIKIGDLMYDEYLRSYNNPTIELNDKDFNLHVNHTVKIFDYWFNFFKKNIVKSVIISHPVYNMGIVCRIAQEFKIPVYFTGPSGMFYLTKKFPSRHSTIYYKKFPKIFKKLNKDLKINLIMQSKQLLNDRFSGKHDLKLLQDRQTNNKFFDKKINLTKLKKNDKYNKVKILVQAHHLSDAPHVYDGKNMFVDFTEWLNFLGMVSKKKNYEWLIKVHPSETKSNQLYFEKLAKKYSNFSILNSDISNSEVINLGIKAVTTVYGSVGHEFPIFGIPVINAGDNGPHNGYKFNYHAKSKNEYLKLLTRIETLKVKKNDVKKIYEFYAIRNCMDFTPIYNQQKYVTKYGKQFYSSKFFEIYLKQNNKLRESKINNDIIHFIKSKTFRMFYNFFDLEEPLIKGLRK